MRGRALEKFEMKVNRDAENGCWQWTGPLSSGPGYGRMNVGGRSYMIHRLAYEHYRGPIAEGLVIDHLCRNRGCVNPDHLDAVQQRVNVLRGKTLPAANVTKTHCPSGHRYDDANTYVLRRKRACRECHRVQQIAYLAGRSWQGANRV